MAAIAKGMHRRRLGTKDRQEKGSSYLDNTWDEAVEEEPNMLKGTTVKGGKESFEEEGITINVKCCC